MYQGSITDIPGIQVGCAQDFAAQTGCTAVLFDKSTTAGVDVRGGGPGTINTDVLSPMTGGGEVDCIMLSGGSAFGLGCVDGAMRWLEERGRGFQTGLKRVPMVSGAIIYDLGLGDVNARPDAAMGYAACQAASAQVPQGSHGAGTGATVGKVLQGQGMEKSGQGTASIHLTDGIIIGAIAVVNALGDVYQNGKIISGLHDETGRYLDSLQLMLEEGAKGNVFGTNTTIGVVATNARLTVAQATKMAMVAHDGLAQAIRPVHTLLDGDTVFGAATGEVEIGENIHCLFAAAAEVMRRAIVNGALAAKEAVAH